MILALRKPLFLIALLVAALGLIPPPIALATGILFGLLFTHPYAELARNGTKWLLQGSVIALGFGMDLHQVLRAGRSGFLYTAAGIAVAMLLGLALGRACRVSRGSSFLISTGTAICGGSAIAAVAPILHAAEEEVAAAFGAVFVLNSLALFLFPIVGTTFHLSQTQFGLWSALAIHDTSSVVGATAHYGPIALRVGTTVKLARALWIVPITFLTALAVRSKDGAQPQPNLRIQWPWFILLFCLAALLNTSAPAGARAFQAVAYLGRLGLTATLFLIGTALNRKTVTTVGHRPFLQAIVLWLIVASLSLVFIVHNYVHL
jgi:uncharacterized integral membrane protein (TIGR00698 family)